MNEVRELFRKIKVKVTHILQKWKACRQSNFGNTGKSVYWLSTVLLSIVIGLLFSDFGLPVVIGFIIAGLIGFLLINIIYALTIGLLKMLLRNGVNSFVYGFFMIAILAIMITIGCSGNLPVFTTAISAIIIVWILQMFVRSLWAFLKNKVHSLSVIITASLTGLFLVLLSVFLLGQGFKDSYIENYLQLNHTQGEELATNTAFVTDISKGNNMVASLEYGTSKDSELKSTVFDMSPFVDGYRGIKGYYRKQYQGYNVTAVPVVGKIWYPLEGDNCPVLFIAHGNHRLTTDSYLGYEYLGEYLASNGYVVVSVDENFCNASVFGDLSEENDGRAVLLLENMKQVQQFNNDSSSPLYQKLDYSRIAIAGHSRGGEMVADAALFNDYSYYPENGNISFDYHFNIKSVIAIAPSVNQYMPADHEVELSDINYLLIQGANDQDVSVFMGTRQYNNIAFTGKVDCFKSSLYIAGANHGQFNTKWGRYDLIEPINQFLNVENLMDSQDQQQILKTYLKVFLDITLKDNTDNKELMYHYQKYSADLPETIYIQSYEDSSFECISSFEEDSNIGTATAKDVTLRAYNTGKWKEEMTVDSSGGNRGNYALRLAWSDTNIARYEVGLTSYNANEKYLQFDIANMDDISVANKVYNNFDCKIILIDKNGNEASLQLSDYYTVYPPLPVKLGKLQFIFNNTRYKHQYQTIRIPMDTINAQNTEFDCSCVSKIQFCFNDVNSGDISLDNLGFSGK